MQSILIISSDKTDREQFAQNLCRSYQIDSFDITVASTEDTIGIEEIKKLQQKILLKPLRGEKKATIIYDAQTMTVEAQNAFLKTLEEPPDNTYLLLTADSLEHLLPTILSRCTMIPLAQKKPILSEKEQEAYKEVLTKLFSPTTGIKLALAQTAGMDKEKACLWLEKAILYMRLQLLQEYEKQDTLFQLVTLLEQFQQTYEIIKTTNVNPRFALENLFLSLVIPSDEGVEESHTTKH